MGRRDTADTEVLTDITAAMADTLALGTTLEDTRDTDTDTDGRTDITAVLADSLEDSGEDSLGDSGEDSLEDLEEDSLEDSVEDSGEDSVGDSEEDSGETARTHISASRSLGCCLHC
jgi:hypothetical protein